MVVKAGMLSLTLTLSLSLESPEQSATPLRHMGEMEEEHLLIRVWMA